MPQLSVITVNYRSPQATVACVKNLERTAPAGTEIIVVDNHSEDDSVGVLRNRLPGITLIEMRENSGFGGGCNAGAKRATGEFLLINNPDKQLAPGGIEKLIARMKEDPSIGIIGPALVYGDGTLRPSARSFPSPLDVIVKRTALARLFPDRIRKYLRQQEAGKEVDVDWVVGGCFLIRRDLFERLGGFDERYFLFFEDTDLCRRIKCAGKRVVFMPSVQAKDRKNRLSEGGAIRLIATRIGRAHLASAVRYFGKWGMKKA